MKRYLYMTFAVLGLLGSTVPHAEAGNLTGVRVSNHEGTSRIVLDVSEMPVSWTQSYNEETHALTLNLGGTTNGLTGPISQNDKKTGVLKGIGLQPVNGALRVTLTANKDVQHHEFALEKPSRIVVDLFSGYAQQTTKDVNKSVTYSKINNTVAEGKIQAFALTVDNDSPMVVAHVPEGKPLSSVTQAHTAIIGAKVKGGSFERPYSVASDGAIDLERISNRGTLRYTPNRGYFIEEKKPLLQAKTKNESFVITSVDTVRKENALTLYTSTYGPSTKTNEYEQIKTLSDRIHRYAPEAKVLTTFYCGPTDGEHKDDLFAVFDILNGATSIYCTGVWALQDNENRSEQCKAKLKSGQEWWSYVCMSNTPGLASNSTAIGNRATMWRNYKEQNAGFLYWVVNGFASVYPLRPRPELPEGDGILIYPGESFGTNKICTSVRLERWRDGAEDYDMLVLYEKKLGRSAALSLLNNVYKSPSNYTDQSKYALALRKNLIENITE